MKNFPFPEGANALTMYCLKGLLQNPDNVDATAVSTLVDDLKNDLNTDVPAQVKSYILGLKLMNVVGEKVLADAVGRVRPFFDRPAGTINAP